MEKYHRIRLLLVYVLVALGLPLSTSYADEFRFDRSSDWDSWTFPRGALVQYEDGSVGLGRIDKDINAVANARDFFHTIKKSRTPIPGGVRFVFSGEETADNLIDGRADTWWQPSQEDVVEDWWVEVDLGRMVNATKIRLIFPDTTGALPFRNFSVYANNGQRANAAKDVFQFVRLGRTTEPNDKRVVEFDLLTLDPGAATGEFMVTGDTLRYAPVQYVRFVPEEHHPGAALAEIEVIALGDNVSLGTIDRGGEVRAGANITNGSAFIDGDHNTNWSVSGGLDWAGEGHYFEWDLGAVYWLDNLVLEVGAPIVYGGIATIREFEISTSDGTQVGGLTSDRVRSNYDYQRLSLVNATPSPVRDLYDFRFPARKVRHLFFRRVSAFDLAKVFYLVVEMGLYGEGHVAEVVMESDFIDLGGTKSIRQLSWDGDLPKGTYIEIRSQTGDTFFIENKYYNKNGIEVTEAQWNKLPKSQKQDVVEIQKPGSDWSGWGPVYVEPKGVFLSPSPRGYVKLQVRLGNDNPEVAPLLRNIVLHYDDALISGGVTSRILPRQAGFDSLQAFSYTLKPTFQTGDQGFDRVHIQTPFPVEDVEVAIGGESVVPLAVEMVGDSLQVDLPQVVRRDSVDLRFKVRIQANATAFDAWVSLAGENLQQGVRPEEDGAATVYVPSVADGSDLIRMIEITPLVSPNGDGINDEASIRFVLAKIEESHPEVSIHDLSGRRVRVIASDMDGFRWDGRDASGHLLPPGAYICRVALLADIGEQSAHRIINLAY